MIVAAGSELKECAEKKCAVALGSFDALHVGHMEIIQNAVAYAKREGFKSVVQLFRIPPSMSTERDAMCVNTMEKRLSVLEKSGVDIVIVESFSDEFKKIGYKDFVFDYLKERYNAAAVFAGYNYRFGFRAEGNVEKLREECTRYGIQVFIQDCVSVDGEVSSSRIRNLIKNGRMEEAARCMGRPYAICGRVVPGRQLGRTIGFPTANICMPTGMVIPQNGVYKTRICLDGKCYDGITNVGGKPTVVQDEQNIETHIIGYEGELYGEEIEVVFCRWLRGIKTFDSLDDLKTQLEYDKHTAKD